MTYEEEDEQYRAAKRAEWVEREMLNIPAFYRGKVAPDAMQVGTGLYLHGTVGTGKTWRACEIMRANIEAGRRSRFVHVAGWVDARREGNGGGPRPVSIAELASSRLLVLDDIGLERPNDYALDAIGTLVNEARLGCTPLIVTSNLTFAQLHDRMGARIVDRLIEVCTPVPMTGASRRLPR